MQFCPQLSHKYTSQIHPGYCASRRDNSGFVLARSFTRSHQSSGNVPNNLYGYHDISRCLLGAETDIGVRPIYGRLSDNLDSSTHKIECDRKLKEEKIHTGEKQRRGGRGGGDLTFRGTHRHLLHFFDAISVKYFCSRLEYINEPVILTIETSSSTRKINKAFVKPYVDWCASIRDFVTPVCRQRERDLINSGKLRRAVVHLVKRDFPTCRMQKRIHRTSASRTGQAQACKHTADRNRVLILIARPKCIWLHDEIPAKMRGQAEKYIGDRWLDTWKFSLERN
ncbi:hypothetical protein EAG_12888 [Camponotus floridanus]|uniref:Uncharacterized protein n=1 Tax=Camponotus floridanus TaxID=104421 RepID=E2ATR6_CAMFO|nr:hypothetical protein EAG_12888 [Camponotus floridanus]